MSIIACILLGILQGITEILPVSSTFHISKFLSYINFENKLLIELINIGSLFAVYLFFIKDYNSAIRGFFIYTKNIFKKKKVITKSEYKFIQLFVASMPAIILLGVFNSVTTLHNISGFTRIIGIISAILLMISDLWNREENISISNLKIVAVIGVSQILAIFPGFSRLGACILIMRILKFERKKAFLFSLFISLPINTANVLFHILLNAKESMTIILSMQFFIIFCVSMTVGLFTIKITEKLITKYTFSYISMYKIIAMLCIK